VTAVRRKKANCVSNVVDVLFTMLIVAEGDPKNNAALLVPASCRRPTPVNVSFPVTIVGKVDGAVEKLPAIALFCAAPNNTELRFAVVF
jgi:hypothetical protein